MRDQVIDILWMILAAGAVATVAGCTAHSGSVGGATPTASTQGERLGEDPGLADRSKPSEAILAPTVEHAPYTPPDGSGALEPAPETPVQMGRMERGDLHRIHFAFDSHTLSPEARQMLDANAGVLTAPDTPRILIEGHADERGTSEYNLALGERRARSAYQYLADLGVPIKGMGLVSFGEERPLDGERSERAWALNRRAEFVAASR